MEGLTSKIAFKRRRKRTVKPTVRIEMQGKRFSVKFSTEAQEPINKKPRGPITCFSRKARAARLRRIAEIDWKAAGESALVTLTYPDDQANHTMQERKDHRYLINRYICYCAGRNLGCLWRVEWKPRLTGKFVGRMLPHMHLLYLGHHNIGEENVREVWMRTIGAKQFTQVDVASVSIGDMVSVYAAKYCSKEANATDLDNVPKRNRTGRHAGELRRNLIPSHPLETVERINDGILRFMQKRACETLWWYDPRFDEGFTILGDAALEMIADFKGMDWTE